MEHQGFLSVLPALVAIVLAFITRRVTPALGLGILLGTGIVVDGMLWRVPWQAWQYLWGALTEGSHLWILTFALSLGGLMRILRSVDGGQGLGERIAHWARTRRGGQLAAWGLGLLFFFDDYANTLFVGSSMGPAVRRLRISREKLAFIIDATAAPVASLAPLSSWIAVELGYIGDQLTMLHMSGDAYAMFLATIPYRYYPLLMLVFGLLIALSGRDFGPMAEAEQAVAVAEAVPATEAVPAPYASAASSPALHQADGSSSLPSPGAAAGVPLLVGLGVLLLVLYGTGLQGALAAGVQPTLAEVLTYASSSKALAAATLTASLTAFWVFGRGRWAQVVGLFREGAWTMRSAVAVLLLAWALGALCADLGTAHYLVGLLNEGFLPALLPTAVFLLSGVMSFATGTSWGTMGILFPLAAPMAAELAPQDTELFVATLAAVLSGSVFGDHCSPISDTTIMSALAAECDQLAHVRTQLPYALCVGLVSVLCCSVPVALGWFRVWTALLCGAVLLGVLIRSCGRVPTPPAAGQAAAAR